MWPPFFFGAIPTYGVLPYAMIARGLCSPCLSKAVSQQLPSNACLKLGASDGSRLIQLANRDRDIDSYISAIRHCVVSFDFS